MFILPTLLWHTIKRYFIVTTTQFNSNSNYPTYNSVTRFSTRGVRAVLRADCIMAKYSHTCNVRYNVLNITNCRRTACFSPFYTSLQAIQVLTRTLFSTQNTYNPQAHKEAANNSKHKTQILHFTNMVNEWCMFSVLFCILLSLFYFELPFFLFCSFMCFIPSLLSPVVVNYVSSQIFSRNRAHCFPLAIETSAARHNIFFVKLFFALQFRFKFFLLITSSFKLVFVRT